MGDIAAGVTAVMLLLIILTCCLCFHPVNKNQDVYKKMAHYENWLHHLFVIMLSNH